MELSRHKHVLGYLQDIGQKRTDLRFLSGIYPSMVKAFDVCSTEIHFRMCDITLPFNWK